MIHVATRTGLFFFSDSGAPERHAFLGDPVTMVLEDPRDGAIYAAVGHGHFGAKLHRSRDGGETWSELPAPRFPEKPEGLDDRSPMSGKPVPWSVDLIWVLEADRRTPGGLWCGTIPGGLFHSTDWGDS